MDAFDNNAEKNGCAFRISHCTTNSALRVADKHGKSSLSKNPFYLRDQNHEEIHLWNFGPVWNRVMHRGGPGAIWT
jgi:hypothetical protein